MYLKRIPNIIKPLAKNLVFERQNSSDSLYLTFDDGPHPTITPWVMDQLEAVNARGTFFLIGKNVEQFPHLLTEILERGHAIGNHSHSHLSGWKTENQAYFKDIDSCAAVVKSKLLRPPYGEITRSQASHLAKEYNLIMWSHLSADFDSKYSAEQCAAFATKKVSAGSIIVFHDSEKAWQRLEHAFPLCLKHYQKMGFQMEVLPMF